MRTAMALRSTSPELFEEQFEQLRGHLGSGFGGMRAVADRTGTDELMLVSQVVDAELRGLGLELLAQAFELAPQPVA